VKESIPTTLFAKNGVVLKMAKKKSPKIIQLKVLLKGVRPPIWRRVMVLGDTTLFELHNIIQAVMGWDDYHLHAITINGQNYGTPEDDMFGDFGTLDEADFRLDQLISSEGQRFFYEYDFGDGWEHTILVEKLLSPEEGKHYPVCIKGKRACPPEDVGGIWGYGNFLEVIQNPDHGEHENFLEWIGGEFDPEEFNLEEVNKLLARKEESRNRIEDDLLLVWEEEEEDLSEDEVLMWGQSLSPEEKELTENLAIRQDILSLLTYIRDNKVTGTSSKGNFPLKAVAEICALFVEPIAMEKTIGDKTVRVRSETEVSPLYYRHALAMISGLIDGGPRRRWKLTSPGEGFLTTPDELQIWILCATWWGETNWMIAAPSNYMPDCITIPFRLVAMQQLIELTPGKQVDFRSFADQLIKDADLTCPIENSKSARIILHNLIECTVINPQIDFGVVEANYQPHETFGGDYRQLSNFSITSFGKSLLKSIQEVVLS
jgi:Plasmid pRiA4b ORF-3-like protein